MELLRTLFRPHFALCLIGLALCMTLPVNFPTEPVDNIQAERPAAPPIEALAKNTVAVVEKALVKPVGDDLPVQAKPGFLSRFQTTKRPGFQEIVQRHFDHWVQEGHLAVNDARINELILNPDVRGAEAAAIATIHTYLVYQRNAGNDPRSLTLEFLTSPEHGHSPPVDDIAYDPYAFFQEFAFPIEMAPKDDPLPLIAPATRATNVRHIDRGDGPVIHPQPGSGLRSALYRDRQYVNRIFGPMADHFNFSICFSEFLKHLSTVPRRVFAVENPTLEGISQGSLGDCYFIAGVGAMAHQRPEQLRNLIYLNKSNSYEVRFPNGQHVHVPPLTDAQLALGSTAGSQGLWLNILEVAAGTVRQRQEKQNDELALDLLGNGGLPAFAVRLLTGNESIRHSTRSNLHNNRTPRSARATTANICGLIEAGLREGRLVSGATCLNVPPGMGPCHEYAIVGLSDNQFEIWNPWGARYNFRPNGPPGLENGYPTIQGRFSMPSDDFLQAFEFVNIETR